MPYIWNAEHMRTLMLEPVVTPVMFSRKRRSIVLPERGKVL